MKTTHKQSKDFINSLYIKCLKKKIEQSDERIKELENKIKKIQSLKEYHSIVDIEDKSIYKYKCDILEVKFD